MTMPLVQTLLALPATQFLLCLARCVMRALLLALLARLTVAGRVAASPARTRRSDANRRRARRRRGVCPHCRTRLPHRRACPASFAGEPA